MNNNKFKQTEIGEIPEDWRFKVSADVLEKIIDYRGKTPPKTSFGIPLVTAKVVKHGRIDYSNSEFISEETWKKWMTRGFPQKGDVVMTTEAPLGEVAQIDNVNIGLAQRLLTLRGKHDILDDTFLKYYLLSFIGQQELAARATGSVVKGIRQSEFRKVRILLPSFTEQQQIANILSSLDDKIEFNKKMNKTLEEIGKALFKRWFVDFEFPFDFAQGKPNLDGKPYKSSGGKMVDSELGEIPEGWKVEYLPETVKIQKGLSYRGNDLVDKGNCALVGLKCFERHGGFRVDGIKYYKGEYKEEHILETGDLVVAMTDLTQGAEVIGNPVLVPFIPSVDKAVASLDVSIIKPTSYLSREYLYLLLTRQESQDFLYGYTNGSTVLHLSIKGLHEFKLLIPPQSVADKFNVLVENVFFNIRKNQYENIILTNLKNSLLPRLMSGKLRVNV